MPAKSTMPDLLPASLQVTALLDGLGDDQLAARTPCDDYTVEGLLVHFMGLTLAFRDAGTKTLGVTTGAPPADAEAEVLEPGWREELPGRLAAMAAAWRQPAAWEGVTEVGGVTLPASSIGSFGLNELVIHGWDLARATGQSYQADQASVEAILELLSETASPDGTPGLFGPIVQVEAGASLLDKAVGLSGRSPAWPAKQREGARNMSLPTVVSREEWLAARKTLLAREKAATKARDALNTARRELPMVKVDKDYAFEGAGSPGNLSLLDLFDGRRQLMIYHFMWLDDKDLGCPSCSGFASEINQAHLDFLNERETTFAFVSRGRIDSIQAFNARMGWPVPWFSSYGSDFNYDFHVTFDESKLPLEYNYRTKEEWAGTGMPIGEWEQPFDLHGLSCFLRDGDDVFHTYSTYGRGTEEVGGPHYFLDFTALGRQEDWELPKGRSSNAPSAGDERISYPDEKA